MEDVKEIRGIVGAINEAWVAGRYEAIGPHVADHVVMAPPGEDSRVMGRDAYVASFRQFAEIAVVKEFVPATPRVDVIGNTASPSVRSRSPTKWKGRPTARRGSTCSCLRGLSANGRSSGERSLRSRRRPRDTRGRAAADGSRPGLRPSVVARHESQGLHAPRDAGAGRVAAGAAATQHLGARCPCRVLEICRMAQADGSDSRIVSAQRIELVQTARGTDRARLAIRSRPARGDASVVTGSGREPDDAGPAPNAEGE